MVKIANRKFPLSFAWHHLLKLTSTPKGTLTNLPFDINEGHTKLDEYLEENVEIYHDKALMQANIRTYQDQPFSLTCKVNAKKTSYNAKSKLLLGHVLPLLISKNTAHKCYLYLYELVSHLPEML